MSKRILKSLVLMGALLALSACYIAPAPPPAYGYAPGYYYAPPVTGSVNLGFGYWGGHRGWR